jgi:hypothetical protein
VTDVREVFTATPACVFFAADRDFSPTLVDPDNPPVVPVQPFYVQLVPHEPTEANPTPWLIAGDSSYSTGQPEEGNPCGG